MNMWNAVHREMSGAWHSLRYDLDLHRAAKLASAYTEELNPPEAVASARTRAVARWGVGMLFVGGAAGAYLAIGGGLAALGTDQAWFEADQVGVASWAPQSAQADRQAPAQTADRPGPPRRIGTAAQPARPAAGTAHQAAALPPLEGSPAPRLSPSAKPSPSTKPSPSAKPSPGPSASAAPTHPATTGATTSAAPTHSGPTRSTGSTSPSSASTEASAAP